MLSLLRSKKAQNTMEYAILIAVVVGALSAMQVYLKRGVQAKLRGGSDKIYGVVLNKIGTEAKDVLGTDTQYEPYYSREGQYSMETTADEGTEVVESDQDSGSSDITDRKVKREGTQSIMGAKKDSYSEGN